MNATWEHQARAFYPKLGLKHLEKVQLYWHGFESCLRCKVVAGTNSSHAICAGNAKLMVRYGEKIICYLSSCHCQDASKLSRESTFKISSLDSLTWSYKKHLNLIFTTLEYEYARRGNYPIWAWVHRTEYMVWKGQYFVLTALDSKQGKKRDLCNCKQVRTARKMWDNTNLDPLKALHKGKI